MKKTIACLLLAASILPGAACAAGRDQKKQEAEVQKELDSIVADCEKRKLPAEKEIACIEEGYLQAMGETAPEGSR